MAGPGAAEAELPATVAAAWGVRERSQKGPKPALSLARIVDAGVRVADSEGLDAVSMGRVAALLDTAPMSLYRHVSSKDELVRLMVDAAWGDSPGPTLAGEDWRAGLSRWAWAMRAALRRHPWAAHIPISGLPIMPREIDEFLAPIPYIIPAQLFAALLADAKGLDPDQPRSLSKITRTL